MGQFWNSGQSHSGERRIIEPPNPTPVSLGFSTHRCKSSSRLNRKCLFGIPRRDGHGSTLRHRSCRQHNSDAGNKHCEIWRKEPSNLANCPCGWHRFAKRLSSCSVRHPPCYNRRTCPDRRFLARHSSCNSFGDADTSIRVAATVGKCSSCCQRIPARSVATDTCQLVPGQGPASCTGQTADLPACPPGRPNRAGIGLRHFPQTGKSRQSRRKTISDSVPWLQTPLTGGRYGSGAPVPSAAQVLPGHRLSIPFGVWEKPV